MVTTIYYHFLVMNKFWCLFGWLPTFWYACRFVPTLANLANAWESKTLINILATLGSNETYLLFFELFMQHIKKDRDPRWEEEFQFVCEEPPTNDKMQIEVMSRPPSIGIHSKVAILFSHFWPLYCDMIKYLLEILLKMINYESRVYLASCQSLKMYVSFHNNLRS